MKITKYARYAIIDPNAEPGPEPVELVTQFRGLEVQRTVESICRDLNEALHKHLSEEVEAYFEGFSVWSDLKKDEMWPLSWRWIAVYPITGGSEAHWIHIDLIIWDHGQSIHRHMAMVKCFGGWEVSCQIANLAGVLLGA